MEENKMILKRFNGKEVYNTEVGEVQMFGKDKKMISLEIDAREYISVLKETREIGLMPNYLIIIYIDDFSDFKKGFKFFNEEKIDQSMFYLYEHELTYNNQFEVLDVKDKSYLIRVTGFTQDPRFYDGSKPDTEFEIISWFKETSCEKGSRGLFTWLNKIIFGK